MKRTAWTLVFVLAGCAVVLAAQDAPAPDEAAFDFDKLWQGALAGLIAAVVRFWSKGKKLKEIKWKYAVIYILAGLLSGVYAAWRGLEFAEVFDFVEGAGLVMVVYMILKGGKVNLGPVVGALLGKKKKGGGETSGDGGSDGS